MKRTASHQSPVTSHDSELFGNYVRLLRKIDEFSEQINHRHPQSINCGPGCAGCCVDGISVWRVEFDNILSRITDQQTLPPTPSNQGRGNERCHFLDRDGRCSIYDARPVVCRLWGTPLMITAGREAEWGMRASSCAPSSKGTIICCDENFAGRLGIEDLTLADAINSETVIGTLAAVNHVYCIERNLDPTQRSPISDALKAR